MRTEMKSLKFPSEMCRLARALPLTSVSDSPGAWVSGRKLHRLLGMEKDFDSWAAFWASEWRAWVEWGWEPDIGEPVRKGDRGECLIYAVLTQTMACNMVTLGTDAASAAQVNAYLHHAERRWRIRNGGALTAREVAEEYHLVDRRTNATRRIGDAICDFAVRHADMPPIADIGGSSRRRRGFPAALIRAWHRKGGGAEMIEAERNRPKRPARRHADVPVFDHEDTAAESIVAYAARRPNAGTARNRV